VISHKSITSILTLFTPFDIEIDELQSTSDGKSVGEKSPQALSPHASNISHGRLGLENLGNTCYLNSSLQLLCHMTPFVEYFLGGYYLREVNSQSKHGYQGRLVSAFGRLLFEIWVQRDSTSSYSGGVAMGMIRGSRTSITPVKFRRLVGTLSEQFSHDDQQDAQEVC
jgi:ubiquitin carboxyl-terminal hydrolase 4/11/15